YRPPKRQVGGSNPLRDTIQKVTFFVAFLYGASK
ncbi:MAG: hypothetical protein ACI9LY_002961, partial [Arenicella sp.]